MSKTSLAIYLFVFVFNCTVALVAYEVKFSITHITSDMLEAIYIYMCISASSFYYRIRHEKNLSSFFSSSVITKVAVSAVRTYASKDSLPYDPCQNIWEGSSCFPSLTVTCNMSAIELRKDWRHVLGPDLILHWKWNQSSRSSLSPTTRVRRTSSADNED